MFRSRDVRHIKEVRNEVLASMKVVYPGGLRADRLMRILLGRFPLLEFYHLKQDLHYLTQKSYLELMDVDECDDAVMTPWRLRWLRLTPTGVEVVDHCVLDPALEE